MKKLIILFLIGGFILGNVASAQSTKKPVEVSGIVVDNQDAPLAGVTIIIKNQPGVGVSADLDGHFTIKVTPGEQLVFTFVGFVKQEYLVTKKEDKLKIVMQADTKEIDEIVVVGLGSQKKVSVVGAISSINIKELETPATSINNMLGGRIPGVITMQYSGEPGKNISDFWIRGIGTFGVGNSALILIDGLEGSLDQIDPSDVESFSVLKDASATAVYGVRGANGVVLVTTKRGKEGKLKITARANYTVSQLKRMPQYLEAYDYAKLANEARVVSGDEPIYDNLTMDLIKYNLDPDLYPNVNWQKEILKPVSLQQTYYMNASGGGSIARYFISTGYSDETAAYRQEQSSRYANDVSYQKFTYRSNVDVNLTSTTKLYMGIDGYITVSTVPGFTNTNQLWALTRTLTPLAFPTRYSTGQLPTYGSNDMFSPYTMLNETGYQNSTKYRNMVTLSLSQDMDALLKGLKARVQVASDYNTTLIERRYLLPDMYKAMGRFSNGQLQLVKTISQTNVNYSRNIDQWRKYHLEAQLNWNRDFGDHDLGALLYYYMQDISNTNTLLDRTGIGNIPERYQGLSGRLTYGLKKTYFMDANFGYTGSANFESGNQFGFFPSIALGWVVTEYNFIRENLHWLNFLKVRYSYGLAGNDRISGQRFPYLTLINNNAGSYWGYNGNGITKTQIGATNLQWETSIKQDLGIEGKLLKDKISFTIDFFRDTRDNIFQKRTTIPDYAGLITMPFGNVGSMYSFGTDGNVEFFQKINKNMDFTIRANYTYAANYVTYYEEAIQPYPYQNATGYPWGVQRGLIALGLFKDEQDVLTSPLQTFGTYRPGDIKYKDVSGDGMINNEDMVPLSYTNNIPRLMYGVGGEFRYKNLTLSVLFKGTGAVEYFRTGRGYDAGWIPFVNGELGNVLTVVNDQRNRWTPAWYSGDPATENPNAMFPRLSYGHNNNNAQLSTFWKKDGSFIRLQELCLNYNITEKKFLKPLGIHSINVQLVGNNLFTIDKVKFFDPEQAQYNGGAYPIPARYSLQLFLNF
ncbi:MAG: TonB-dependent receptor [Paludibacter sp.]|nr:TonB-dependent receptor [Paludibacter sp.]